jgi:CYTH domain-containing protein
MPLEIERKFLLRKFPDSEEKFETNLIIEQFYTKESDRVERYRIEKGDKFERFKLTTKTPLSHGVFEEIETKITEEEWMKRRSESLYISYIFKTRFKTVIDGLTWEVDRYENLSLTIMEVELPDINHPIVIPDFINKEIIKEVTGDKPFANFNLGLGLSMLDPNPFISVYSGRN